MKKPFSFPFMGKQREANVHISLQEDGCYLFTILQDKELIEHFGTDIDFETDGEKVIPHPSTTPSLVALQEAILNAAKRTPEFLIQKSLLSQQNSQ